VTDPAAHPSGANRPGRARRTNPLVVVCVLLFAMVVYFVLIGVRGFYLLGQDRWVLTLLGLAVLVLPLIGVWVVVAELRFGAASQRLAERMRAEGRSTDLPELPRRASGRLNRAAADVWFDQQRILVERAPQDWASWFRLAQAYDLAGDRRRAREALRTAIEKANPRP
jgi:hypothetical protein